MANQRIPATTAQRMARTWGFGDVIHDTDLNQDFYGDLITLGGTVFGDPFSVDDLGVTGDEGDIITLGTDGETLEALPVEEAFPAPLYNDGLLGVADGDGPGPAALLNAGEAQVHILAAIEDALTPAHVADPDLFFAHRMRSAAFSGLGASGVGAFASHTLQLTTAAPSFEIEMVLAYSAVFAASCSVFGNTTAGLPTLLVTPLGAIYAYKGVAIVANSAVGGIPKDGLLHTVRLVGGTSGADSTATIYVDGVQVATGSLAGNWSTASVTSYIGGEAAGSGQRWPGSIHNVTYTDLVTAASSRTFLMDEVAGDYADSSGNGGAAAVRNGLVRSVGVVSTDGRGMPWQGGVQTLTYMGLRYSNGPQSITADTQATFAVELDPTSHFNPATGAFTAPCAGKVRLTWHVGCMATAVAAADDINFLLLKNGSSSGRTFMPLTFSVPNARLAISVFDSFDVATSDTVAAYIENIVALDTYDLYGQLAIEFTPASVPG